MNEPSPEPQQARPAQKRSQNGRHRRCTPVVKILRGPSFLPPEEVPKMTAALSRPPTVFGSPGVHLLFHRLLLSSSQVSTHRRPRPAVPRKPSFFSSSFSLCSPSPPTSSEVLSLPNSLPPYFPLPSFSRLQTSLSSHHLCFPLVCFRAALQRKKPTSTSKPPVSTRLDKKNPLISQQAKEKSG